MASLPRTLTLCRLDETNLLTSLIAEIYLAAGATLEQLGEDLRTIYNCGVERDLVKLTWLVDLLDMAYLNDVDCTRTDVQDQAYALLTDVEATLARHLPTYRHLYLVGFAGTYNIYLEHH